MSAVRHAFNTAQPSKKLIVLGMRWATCHITLKNYFDKYGIVEKTRVVIDMDTGRSKGFGFVTMQSVKGAERAMKAAPHTIDGHQVELDYRRATLQNHEMAREGDKTSPHNDTAHKIAGGTQIGTGIKTALEKKRNDISALSMPLSDIDFQVARARGQINISSESDLGAMTGGTSGSTAAEQDTNPITNKSDYSDIGEHKIDKMEGTSNIKSHSTANQQNSAATKYAAINFETLTDEEQSR